LILVDTSVWVDHFRRGDAHLVDLLQEGRVAMHPFVVGEIACGSLKDRSTVIALLQSLPRATVAEAEEVLGFVGSHRLHGKGIGYIDAHLLASTALTEGASLWTRDKRLRIAAEALGFSHRIAAAH
jgi:predicted nucleic acid-binding protein